MVNKCCVPGCSSNYASSVNEGRVTCFNFPSKQELQKQWIKKIPRENLVISKHTVVCVKHFKEEDIVRNDILPGKNGEPDIIIPRKRLKLKSDAVPSLFPNLPAYLSDTQPATRASPSKRKRKYEELQNALQDEWINADRINSYEDLLNKMNELIRQFTGVNMLKHTRYVLFYSISEFTPNFDSEQCPVLTFCFKVSLSLEIVVWKCGMKLSLNDLSWLNLQSGVVSHWSQLENLITYLKKEEVNVSDETLVKNAVSLLNKISSEDNKDVRHFLTEQLQLSVLKPTQRRFSTDCLIMAFSLHFKSASVYEYLRDSYLILPSSRLLRKLSANISPDLDSNSCVYLEKKAQYLKDSELYVNVLLDEIHVKPLLSYKNGKLTGCSEKEIATTIHCFMISSIFSSNKDVVKFLPAKKMPAENLLPYMNNVVMMVRKAGFRVVSIITDGNRINKKLFTLLSGVNKRKDLPTFISDPIDKNEKIFLLFDSVHILKCIRNNWINLKNHNKTFTFPDFSGLDTMLRASFGDLECIHDLEVSKVLKEAPQLSWKALHPHSLERQNVKLALKIFADTNAAALKCYGPTMEKLKNWEGTSSFISVICKWWNIVNVHHPYKGRNTRNADAEPIRTSDDSRLDFLLDMAKWLDHWSDCNKQSNEGFLTEDTYFALAHTLRSLVELVIHLLQTLHIDFILTGKFQTDDLESRFGHYRQMSGGNRLVSIQEIMESEKKLKIDSLLKLFTPDGELSVRNYLCDFSDGLTSNPCRIDQRFVENFPYFDVSFDEENLPVLIYIAGYVAAKIKSKLNCTSCEAMVRCSDGLEVEIDSSVNE